MLIIIGGLAATGYLLALKSDDFRWQAILKPIPVLCMLFGLWPMADRHASVVAVGLAFSVVGDVLLLWTRRGPNWFVFGLVSFLLSHLAYIYAYVGIGDQPALWLLFPAALYGVLVARRLWPHLGEMRWPVLIYIVVICTMVWRAGALFGTPRGLLALAGAILFALSDTLLAFNRFVRPIPNAAYAIMALYWAGQLGITLSVWSAGV